MRSLSIHHRRGLLFNTTDVMHIQYKQMYSVSCCLGCSLAAASWTLEQRIMLSVKSEGIFFFYMAYDVNETRLTCKRVTAPTNKAEVVTVDQNGWQSGFSNDGLLYFQYKVHNTCVEYETVITKRNTFNMKYVKIHSATSSVPLCPFPHFAPSICHPHSHSSLHSLLVPPSSGSCSLGRGFFFPSFPSFMSDLSFMRPFSSPLPSISIPLSWKQNPHDAKMALDAPALALL